MQRELEEMRYNCSDLTKEKEKIKLQFEQKISELKEEIQLLQSEMRNSFKEIRDREEKLDKLKSEKEILSLKYSEIKQKVKNQVHNKEIKVVFLTKISCLIIFIYFLRDLF